VREDQYAFKKVTYDADPRLNPALRFERRSSPHLASACGRGFYRWPFTSVTVMSTSGSGRAALYQDLCPECTGCTIEFDLNELISAVYIGLRADEFLFGVVDLEMEKFELTKPLERSALLQPPERTKAAT